MSEQWSIKHRPIVLSDVFGQAKIVNELKSRTLKNTWPNAILIQGRFGTGKTTMAQIIAMNANCKHTDDNGNACLTCASCKSIQTEQFSRDTQVLDGALIGGKNDMTDFLSNINQPPLYDPRRIMIIEEADQLSSSAVNALHKALEKPRSNILFILLSMINKGVPQSIESRCQKYPLKDVSVTDTMFYLKSVLEKEGLWKDTAIPDEFRTHGLALLAEGSRGSLRSAIQLLERCVMGQYYTVADIQENLELVTDEVSMDFIGDLLNLKGEAVFRKLDEVDVSEFIQLGSVILANAYAYRESGYIKNEYFATRTGTMARHNNFLALVETFEKILVMSKPFLRKSEVVLELSKYLMSRKAPTGVTPLRVRGA